MPDEKIEQRVNLKILVKLGKSATESFRLLYMEMMLCHDHVFLEWHRPFREGREEVDDLRPC